MRLDEIFKKDSITQAEADQAMTEDLITKTEIKQTIAHWDKKIKFAGALDGFVGGFGKYHIEDNEIVYGDIELKIRNAFLNAEGELILPFKYCRELVISASNLKSFKNFPKTVNSTDFSWAILSPLIGSSQYIDKLDGFPSTIVGSVDIANDRYRHISYHNVHKHIKSLQGIIQLHADYEGPVLGFLMVEKLKNVLWKTTSHLNNSVPTDILRSYLEGSRDIMDCQEELIQAGYKEFAKL